MLLRRAILAFASCISLVQSQTNLTRYEYIVIGSGAGGGPLDARLALAGHKTLLIEAGDDQGANDNYTVPAYQAKSPEDPNLAWEFFVRHYSDDTRQRRDYKLTYDTQNGQYTGLNPPAGPTIKGVLYPRTAHNALVTVYPHRSDFQYIADLTGDASWSPDNMRKYLVRMEDNNYLSLQPSGHGYDGWLSTLLTGAGFALGNYSNTLINIATLLAGDTNADSATRDRNPALHQIPIAPRSRRRNGSRSFILQVANARHPNGSKRHPLDLRPNRHATKVTFATSTPSRATTSREVLVSGGSSNSPPLRRLGIPVVADRPCEGANLQDHYEAAVPGRAPAAFAVLDGCMFGVGERWRDGLPLVGQTYEFAGAMVQRKGAAPDGDFDGFAVGGPVDFCGYFPGCGVDAAAERGWWGWAVLKAHPRNRAGGVALRSADPLGVTEVLFNYFDTGDADAEQDLQGVVEGIALARDAFKRQLVKVDEVLPGPGVQSAEQVRDYIKDTAWGHHCSSTCPIGTDDDPMVTRSSG